MTTSFNDEENIINWEEEATAIINDVKSHVEAIEISKVLPASESNIYLNLRTIEGNEYCVHVSSMGFRIVSNAYDTVDADKSDLNEEECYETPYALLDKISPRYIESFGSKLCQQLLNLQQGSFNEEDEENLEGDDDANMPNSTENSDKKDTE